MKKYTYITLLTILPLLSCETYTEDLNSDPNNFNNSAPELIIGQAQLGWMQLAESNSARYAGIFMNHFTGSDRQYVTLNGYSVTSGEFNDMWDDAYVDGIAQAQVTQKAALENENTKLVGVAQIAEAAMFGEMTALYGDIPFTQANKSDEFYQPEYDSQTTVYSGVQNLLDQAIDYLGEESVSLYAGNRLSSDATWGQVAHSLKARYFLHTKDYTNALRHAQMGIEEGEDLMVLHGESLENRNLYYQFTVDEREGYLDANGSYLFQLLDQTDDVERRITTPGDSLRLNYYFTGTTLNVESDGAFGQTTSFPLISWIEVKLIAAESHYRTGDESAARDAFNEVRNHLADRFDGDFPTTDSGGEDLLLEILEEKYVSLVGQLEPYHDIRRTNNLLDVPPKTGSTIPQRFLYPQVEIDNNPNVPDPIPGLYDKTPVNN
ncbi:MAG: SusD/RagB family nutrient-binding outer membrane lipoprotein [Flavobacteriaceae bacterium]